MNTNILDFGAISGGQSLCTQAIQAAIDACAVSGGGRVTVPAGTYLTGSIWLKSHVELHLEHGSVLKASENLDDYNAEDAYEQNWANPTTEKWVGKHLLLCVEQTDVALTGTGVLDGSGDAFMGERRHFSNYCWRYGLSVAKDEEKLRPGQLVCFVESQNITVTDVTLRNLPCWGLFLHGCDVATIRGVKVFSPPNFGNSDGIDIDACRFVTISDCVIDTGDDAIAIRGCAMRIKDKQHPCEYITVSNCVLGSSSSVFRIGVGQGVVRHIRISNITATRGGPLVTFMTGYRGVGFVPIEDVHFSHISATNIATPIEVEERSGAHVQNVTFEDVYVEAYIGCRIYTDNVDTIRDWTLRNFHYNLVEGPAALNRYDKEIRGTKLLHIQRINGLTLDNVRIDTTPALMEPFTDGIFGFEECTNVVMRNVTPSE